MEYLAKLKDMEEAKERISYIQNIKKSMVKFYDFLKDENENINEYKKEMDELYKEKMMHVEELRLIHTDINLMEMVIKQSNEHKNYCLYEAKRLYDEYQESRTILSGLKSSIGIEEEFKEVEEGLFKDMKEQEEFETFLNKSLTLSEDGNYNTSAEQLNSNTNDILPISFPQSQERNESIKHFGRQQTSVEIDNTYQALADFANNRALSFFGIKHNADLSNAEEEYHESVHGEEAKISPAPKRQSLLKKSSATVDNNTTRDFGFYNFHQASPSTLGTAHGTLANNYTFEMPVPPFSGSSSAIIHRPSSAIFRNQQPPPMKTCLSCHQQIHRNAPICPLCKAKSRSRNPKKPKKKM